MTKFQRASNCNEVKAENSLDEKILVFDLENGYNFILIEKAKGLSYELEIFTQDSSDACLPPLQTASSYSDRKCPFEGLEVVFACRQSRQRSSDAAAA